MGPILPVWLKIMEGSLFIFSVGHPYPKRSWDCVPKMYTSCHVQPSTDGYVKKFRNNCITIGDWRCTGLHGGLHQNGKSVILLNSHAYISPYSRVFRPISTACSCVQARCRAYFQMNVSVFHHLYKHSIAAQRNRLIEFRDFIGRHSQNIKGSKKDVTQL